MLAFCLFPCPLGASVSQFTVFAMMQDSLSRCIRSPSRPFWKEKMGVWNMVNLLIRRSLCMPLSRSANLERSAWKETNSSISMTWRSSDLPQPISLSWAIAWKKILTACLQSLRYLILQDTRSLLQARWCAPTLSIVDVRVGDDQESTAQDPFYRFGPTRFSVIPRLAVGNIR